MSTPLSLPQTPQSKEDAQYDQICEEYNHLIETLPKGNGWMEPHLYNYKGFWISPRAIKSHLLLHAYYKPQPTDIYLASFMKSGTTWLKALIFSTLNRHRYSFSDHPLQHHGPHNLFHVIDIECETYPITDLTHLSAPRLFGTHFPRTLLPSSVTSCKCVYICRDPKDVLISKWIFMSKLRDKDLPPLTFEAAFNLFCEGISNFGSIWEHALTYWRASLESTDTIMFLKYEDVKKQPEVVVRKLADFLGVPFTLEEVEKGVVGNLVNLCSFKNLSNMEVNKKGVDIYGKTVVQKSSYFRKGEVGDWKNYLTDEMKEHLDGIIKDKLKDSGFMFGQGA